MPWIHTHPELGVCIDPEIRPAEAGYDVGEDRWVLGAGHPGLYGWWSGWKRDKIAVSSRRCLEPELSDARRFKRKNPREQAKGVPQRLLDEQPAWH